MPLCFYSFLGDVIHASRYRRSSCVGRFVQAGSVEGAGLDVCDPTPLYVNGKGLCIAHCIHPDARASMT